MQTLKEKTANIGNILKIILQSLAEYVANEKSGEWFPQKSRESILIGIHGNAEYSPRHLMYSSKRVINCDKQQQEKILNELNYLEKRKLFYTNKTLNMESLDKYLLNEVYR